MKREVSGHRVTFCCIMPCAFSSKVPNERPQNKVEYEILQDRKSEMPESALISEPHKDAVFELRSTSPSSRETTLMSSSNLHQQQRQEEVQIRLSFTCLMSSNGPPNHQDMSITQNMCTGSLEVLLLHNRNWICLVR